MEDSSVKHDLCGLVGVCNSERYARHGFVVAVIFTWGELRMPNGSQRRVEDSLKVNLPLLPLLDSVVIVENAVQSEKTTSRQQLKKTWRFLEEQVTRVNSRSLNLKNLKRTAPG
ncbi:hypothetical protein E3N88_37763 [Mikania micrantha]|uniref:Uncharacterized protein n=1 Tax=Mikania micrantha TaxID=192012 RepID=A0A5N6LS01_9ASTR|nr:hypothetical protein E3N88_37763 [Mikania micrantha]